MEVTITSENFETYKMVNCHCSLISGLHGVDPAAH